MDASGGHSLSNLVLWLPGPQEGGKGVARLEAGQEVFRGLLLGQFGW